MASDQKESLCTMIAFDESLSMGELSCLDIAGNTYTLRSENTYKILLKVPLTSPSPHSYNPTCLQLTGCAGHGVLRLYKQSTIDRRLIPMDLDEVRAIISDRKIIQATHDIPLLHITNSDVETIRIDPLSARSVGEPKRSYSQPTSSLSTESTLRRSKSQTQ